MEWKDFARHILCSWLRFLFASITYSLIRSCAHETVIQIARAAAAAKKIVLHDNAQLHIHQQMENCISLYSFRWHSYHVQCAMCIHRFDLEHFSLSFTVRFSYVVVLYKSRCRCSDAATVHTCTPTKKRAKNATRCDEKVCKSLKWYSELTVYRYRHYT